MKPFSREDVLQSQNMKSQSPTLIFIKDEKKLMPTVKFVQLSKFEFRPRLTGEIILEI